MTEAERRIRLWYEPIVNERGQEVAEMDNEEAPVCRRSPYDHEQGRATPSQWQFRREHGLWPRSGER